MNKVILNVTIDKDLAVWLKKRARLLDKPVSRELNRILAAAKEQDEKAKKRGVK